MHLNELLWVAKLANQLPELTVEVGQSANGVLDFDKRFCVDIRFSANFYLAFSLFLTALLIKVFGDAP